MKKALFFLAAVGLLVGLTVMPLVAENVQTASVKWMRAGVGMGISDINYIAGVAEFSVDQNKLWLSLGFAGYPSGEPPSVGMILAFPGSISFFTDKITIFGKSVSWGLGGLGFVLYYVRSPKLPGITVSFANFSILPLQAEWEGKLYNHEIFLKGGPYLTLGPGVFGFLVEGGIWFI